MGGARRGRGHAPRVRGARVAGPALPLAAAAPLPPLPGPLPGHAPPLRPQGTPIFTLPPSPRVNSRGRKQPISAIGVNAMVFILFNKDPALEIIPLYGVGKQFICSFSYLKESLL